VDLEKQTLSSEQLETTKSKRVLVCWTGDLFCKTLEIVKWSPEEPFSIPIGIWKHRVDGDEWKGE
jgi:hypothetical protein